MKYIHATRDNQIPNEDREYDACYYEIIKDPQITDKIKGELTSRANGGELKIYFELTIADEIDVYIYKGKDRSTSYETIIERNVPATTGKTYSLTVEKGFLVVAIPRDGI